MVAGQYLLQHFLNHAVTFQNPGNTQSYIYVPSVFRILSTRFSQHSWLNPSFLLIKGL